MKNEVKKALTYHSNRIKQIRSIEPLFDLIYEALEGMDNAELVIDRTFTEIDVRVVTKSIKDDLKVLTRRLRPLGLRHTSEKIRGSTFYMNRGHSSFEWEEDDERWSLADRLGVPYTNMPRKIDVEWVLDEGATCKRVQTGEKTEPVYEVVCE